jgi:hypothetical protein
MLYYVSNRFQSQNESLFTYIVDGLRTDSNLYLLNNIEECLVKGFKPYAIVQLRADALELTGDSGPVRPYFCLTCEVKKMHLPKDHVSAKKTKF